MGVKSRTKWWKRAWVYFYFKMGDKRYPKGKYYNRRPFIRALDKIMH